MPASPTHVADASAMIALLKDELGSAPFSQILSDTRNVVVMHATNLCEVYYNYLHSDGLERAEQAWDAAIQVVSMVEKMDAQFLKRVSRWKVEHGLPLIDAFAAATTEEFSAILVTTDHNHFDPIDQAGTLQIVWLR